MVYMEVVRMCQRFRKERGGQRGDPRWWSWPVIGRLSRRRQQVLDLRREFEDPDAARRMIEAHPEATADLLRSIGYPLQARVLEDEGRRS
jgi:hypothetical protein